MKFLLLLAICAGLLLGQDVQSLPASSSLASPDSTDASVENGTASNSADASVENGTASNSTDSSVENETAEADSDEAVADGAITCGRVGGGSRKRVYFCAGENHILDENKLDTVCPDDECTDELCCVLVEAEAVVVDKEEQIAVEKPAGPPANELQTGTCGMVTGGSRPARHVCKGQNLMFNPYAANVQCGENGCSDARCCQEIPFVPRHNCGNKNNWTPEKERYCCIAEGVGCKPLTCSHGLGFLSEDRQACCPNHCGMCGGVGCYISGGPECCTTLIVPSGRPCSHYPAPCANFVARVPEWEKPSFTQPWTQPALPFMDWAPAPQPALAACIPRRRQFNPTPRSIPRSTRMGFPAFNPSFPTSFNAPFPTSFNAPSAVILAAPYEPYTPPAIFPASLPLAEGGLPWCDFEYPAGFGDFVW